MPHLSPMMWLVSPLLFLLILLLLTSSLWWRHYPIFKTNNSASNCYLNLWMW